MGDYLNNSSADYIPNSNVNNADSETPNFEYTSNYNYDSNSNLASQPQSYQQHQQHQQHQQQLQQNQSLNLNFDANNNNAQNDYSLNINYSGYSGSGNSNANLNTSNNSTEISAYNSNTQLVDGQDYLSPMGFTTFNAQSDTNVFGGGSIPGSFTNEPFLDDVAFSQAILGPQLHLQNSNTSPRPLSPNLSGQQFVNPISNSVNLDELISPQNNDESSFLNPQFFSPSTRGEHLSGLGSIAEDNKNNLAFSPDFSKRQSISGASFSNNNNTVPDLPASSYLSPQLNPTFASPAGVDAIPYLNSPPQHPPIKTENWNALSPPPHSSALSSSVPTSSGNGLNRDVPTKQLSKEEKMKRRREFHNAVERRRRDLIKERIKELGVIVPPSLLNPPLSAVQNFQRKGSIESGELSELIGSVKVKETKPNKSTILNRSVDYINHLNYVLKQQEITRVNLLAQIELLENSNGSNTSSQAQSQTSSQQSQFQSHDAYYFDQSTGSTTSNREIANYNPEDFFADIGTSTENI
ncbi:transcription factor, putative [Candida dubliniensis CD36]|uniref:Transcription factor, putative n=1 Tax=Candida dubliniensis (strain CD36 / ATCC MYA-646 / CBS 7987 / NCPF 3949 / NRRL Y-17841) TaxID=573826 RepID=B9W9A4_CANDC|nr:transcription factor, putative [Candida dubliniensis CD36]CAX45380.1 transcription factor, putative [Candida dubliniensis CD36]